MWIRKTDIMVSMPLWEIGHCGTSDLGSMSVQSVAQGTHCALACSSVQRALSRAGMAARLCNAALSPVCIAIRGTEALILTSLDWKAKSVPHLLSCNLSSLFKISSTCFFREKWWRRGRRGVWVSSLRSKGVWTLLSRHPSNFCSETQARVCRVGLTSGRDPC